MACASSITVCPVCLDNFVDARVLPCLHSVCKACIDKMDVTATDGNVTCPVCRASVTLPSSGAAALPKDVIALETAEVCECASCDDDKTRKPAKAWCKECRLAFCLEHAGPHVVSVSSSGETHSVISLSLAMMEESASESSHSCAGGVVPMCPQHGEPLKFHCGACDVAICGDCGMIGDHQDHKPVRYIRDIVDERKRQVAEKVNKLEREFTEKLEHSLHAVDHVSKELARRADEARTDIRQAGKQAVQMVEAHVEQMVEEIDDMEASRCKILDRQRDELKSFLDSAQNAVRFKERVMHLNVGKEALFSLLQALETRATSLLCSYFFEQPQHHSRITISMASDSDLANKSKEAVGKVVNCQASARHSVIEGSASRKTEVGAVLRVLVMAKGRDGQRITTGGDVISVQCTPMSRDRSRPQITVNDNDDGTYMVAISSHAEGEFRADVFVNGEKMVTSVNVAFLPPFRFDPNECHVRVVIGKYAKKATFESGENSNFNWVLSTTSMSQGQYTWKMTQPGVTSLFPVWINVPGISLGVSTKPSPSSRKNVCDNVAYCWKLNHCAYYHDSVQCSQEKIKAERGDVIQFDLDCDRHTLQITNLCNGETGTFSNLPDKEYFHYAAMFGRKGYSGSVEFVQ